MLGEVGRMKMEIGGCIIGTGCEGELSSVRATISSTTNAHICNFNMLFIIF